MPQEQWVESLHHGLARMAQPARKAGSIHQGGNDGARPPPVQWIAVVHRGVTVHDRHERHILVNRYGGEQPVADSLRVLDPTEELLESFDDERRNEAIGPKETI